MAVRPPVRPCDQMALLLVESVRNGVRVKRAEMETIRRSMGEFLAELNVNDRRILRGMCHMFRDMRLLAQYNLNEATTRVERWYQQVLRTSDTDPIDMTGSDQAWTRVERAMQSIAQLRMLKETARIYLRYARMADAL